MQRPAHLDLQHFLDRLTSRSVLSDEEQAVILSLPTHSSQIHAKHDFVRSGEQVDHACFVLDGLVGRFNQTLKGARQITALHVPGDMPDLLSLVQPRATSALQALTTTTILRVPHSALNEATAKYPAIAEAFWRDCMVDSMILAQWVVNVGRRNAQNRISHLFCEMACRLGAVGDSGSVTFKLRMTQDQLAATVGLTPVHVNRTLKALAAAGTSFRQGTVRIKDWDSLTEAGDFDSNYLAIQTKPKKRSQPVPRASTELAGASI